jgi:ketosteroid isomerase-like protein
LPEHANEQVVQRLIDGLNAGDISVMNDVFVDDSLLVWPQSGETIRGRDNRQATYGAFPALPTITPHRILSSGDLVTAEATLDYGGDVYQVVFIFEFRDGRITRETAYWSKPFPAPEWRAQWVERATE